MWIGAIRLFPEMFRAITDYGVTGRAVKMACWASKAGVLATSRMTGTVPWTIVITAADRDVMMVQPLRDAIHAAKAAAGEGAKVIYLSPQGRKLDQAGVSELATNQKLILVCGRYEGIDERVIQSQKLTKNGQSAITFSAVVSYRQWRWLTPFPGSFREYWAMKHRQRKIPLLMGCWIAPLYPSWSVRGDGSTASIAVGKPCWDTSLASEAVAGPHRLEDLNFWKTRLWLKSKQSCWRSSKLNTRNSSINMMGRREPQYQFTRDKRLNYEQHY